MGPASSRATAVLALLLVGATVAAAPPGASSNLGEFDAHDRGCYCHGTVTSPNVGFSVEGLPGNYTPGATYTLWINVTFTDVAATENRSQGGFYLNASDGTLAPANGSGGALVQVQGREATHTLNGSFVRRWQVLWTAPDQPGRVITFRVDVNTVNGNRSETLGSDHWTFKTITIGVGDEPRVEGPPPPVQRLALETYGALAVGVGTGLFAFYLFRTSARRVDGPPEGDRPPETEGDRPPKAESDRPSKAKGRP